MNRKDNISRKRRWVNNCNKKYNEKRQDYLKITFDKNPLVGLKPPRGIIYN